MKRLIILFALVLNLACKKEAKQTVELSCGQCQFGLTSQDGCDLVVRLDGKAYFVDGANIDDFGDAHDKDSGFCEVVRKAEVSGKIKGDRFEVNSVKMLD